MASIHKGIAGLASLCINGTLQAVCCEFLRNPELFINALSLCCNICNVLALALVARVFINATSFAVIMSVYNNLNLIRTVPFQSFNCL